jgi:uncharacterized protein (UPF0332 family)
VRPEAARYREKAREDLNEARQIAARSAYDAAFHAAEAYAAEAYIVEKSGRIAKTHSGVRSEFSRLAKEDPNISRGTTAFRPKAYRYNEIGDYDVTPDTVITMADAETAIAAALVFC